MYCKIYDYLTKIQIKIPEDHLGCHWIFYLQMKVVSNSEVVKIYIFYLWYLHGLFSSNKQTNKFCFVLQNQREATAEKQMTVRKREVSYICFQ